jgi:hypothetical protein
LRHLTQAEDARLAALTASNASVALLEITKTGHGKSIMDATAPLRRLLAEAGLHDYSAQAQGQDAKARLPAVIHHEGVGRATKASLYRPSSKDGDPRIWFDGLKEAASPGDILALLPFEGTLHVINLSALDERALGPRSGHSAAGLLARVLDATSAIPRELLGKLREIAAAGPLPSVIEAPADTAVGRTLEAALGIGMNASKAPDYKGIELKSFRRRAASKQVRKTLFAQVPDWSASKMKSSGEILAAFGYERGGVLKLYCQVEATRRNPQGLMLRLDADADRLWENSDIPAHGDFAAWPLARLKDRLLEKHAETFWVGATQIVREGRESFQLVDVTHTRRPVASQFDILIEQGVISMDHLVKRRPNGSVSEKGPLFKIEASALPLLFPPPVHYSLA